MDHTNNANRSIRCSVDSCAHHDQARSLCRLASIQVGCCGPTSSSAACTECASFQLGSNRNG